MSYLKVIILLFHGHYSHHGLILDDAYHTPPTIGSQSDLSSQLFLSCPI